MAMPAAYAIRLEVLAIDGEDSPRAQRFGGGDKRCVGVELVAMEAGGWATWLAPSHTVANALLP